MIPDNLTVVLVEPQNPINLGTVIRAMKNMGASHLSLVRPAQMDLDKTQISAHHTSDFLESIQVFDSLDEAIGNCRESFGFSARKRTQTWASIPVIEAAERVHAIDAQQGQTAFVFGREQTGLTNDELERCTFRVHIPTSDYTSMNLSQAVLVALYELGRQTAVPIECADAQFPQNCSACGQTLSPVSALHLPSPSNGKQRDADEDNVTARAFPDNYAPGSVPATLRQQRMLLDKLGNTLVNIGYYKSDAPNTALHRVQNILTRAQLHDDEINLLMGMCGEVENYARLLRRGISPSTCRPRDSLLPESTENT